MVKYLKMDESEINSELEIVLENKGLLKPKHIKNSKSVRQLPKRKLDFDLLKREQIPRVKYITGVKKNAQYNEDLNNNVLIQSLLQYRNIN